MLIHLEGVQQTGQGRKDKALHAYYNIASKDMQIHNLITQYTQLSYTRKETIMIINIDTFQKNRREQRKAEVLATERFEMLYKLWHEWVQSLNENERDKEVIALFLQETGARDSSPLVGMFEAFVGGLYKGFAIADDGKDTMERSRKKDKDTQ